jgi:hypothetical protein
MRYELIDPRTFMVAGLIALLSALGACGGGDDDGQSDKPQAANPIVEGPVTGGGGEDCCKIVFGPLEIDLRDLGFTPGTPFYAGVNYDEAEVGYRETEYFISGTATSYIATDELGEDGVWSVQPADTAPFKSRIVVLRPENERDFNGTVVVEWFNVSGGVDAAPDWIQMHTELVREGYAWVGVSAQSVGVEGGGVFDIPLKTVDAERYGSLSHPGDSFSYDIFSQAAQAVRNPVGLDPLDGLKVARMIGIGESQSAGRLATYVNAIHPTIELFDGFLIHSRGAGSAPLSQAPQAEVSTPNPTFTRTDLPEPIIAMQTETDVFGLGGVGMRQPDAPLFRLWEVGGSGHSDAYTVIKGPVDRGDDPAVAEVIETKDARPPFIECDLPINDGPGHWVLKAAIAALDGWIRRGDAAPSAPLLDLNEEGTALERDSFGNAIGGVRSPYLDAPVATLSGEGQSGTSFCALFGVTELFDDATLSMLYPTREDYIDAIDAATDSAVEAGFLRPADADLIKAQARNSDIRGTVAAGL